MGYIYNATDADGTGAPGHYGANPPISGLVLLRTVGDMGLNRLPTSVENVSAFSGISLSPTPA